MQVVEFNSSAKAWADILDPNPRNCLIKRQFEPSFFDLAVSFMERGGIFFDVGANFGFCSFGVAALLKDFDIGYHLFEANPEVYKILLKSIGLHKGQRFYISNSCVSNEAGTSRIKIVTQQLGMSYIDSKGDYVIENLVLDDYIESHNIHKVNFMKIDIEGWEPFAIQGASESIRTGKIEALYIEISPENLNRSNISAQQFIEYLKSLNLKVFYCKPADFPHSHNSPKNLRINSKDVKVVEIDNSSTNYNQTDILAIHKESKFLN
ncbi:MAG: FkbM family methyltransferase [Tildeniella torsiva UHER 1998/13D]|nr:FkbM family methyltransferase [Tildeniella torsiva UHER 1998/13D]